MTTKIGEIEVEVVARLDKLERDLKRLEKKTRKAADTTTQQTNRMAKGFKAVGKKVSGLVLAYASIQSIRIFAQQARDAIAFADKIAKVSDKLGVSTGFLQELRFAAKQSGVALRTVEMGFQRFARRAAEAAAGTGEAQDAIKQLKLQLRDTATGELKSTEQMFTEAMKALGEIESPAEKLRLAFKLFDSEGVALLNLARKFDILREQARRMGVVIDDEIIRRSEDAQNQLDALATITKTSVYSALIELAPLAILVAQGIAKIAVSVRDVVESFQELNELGLQGVNRRILELQDRLYDAEKAFVKFGGEITGIGEFHVPDFLGNRYAKEQLVLVKELGRALTEAKNRQTELMEQGKKSNRGGSKTDPAFLKQEETARKDFLDSLVARELAFYGSIREIKENELRVDIAKAREAFKNDKEFKKQKKRLEKIAYAEIVQLEKEHQGRLDVIADQVAEEKQDRLDSALESLRVHEKSKLAVSKSIRTQLLSLEDKREELAKISHQDRLDMITEEKLVGLQADQARAESRKILELELGDIAEARVEEAKRLLDDEAGEWDGFYDFLADGFEDALADMIVSGEVSFKRLGDAFMREFVQRAISSTTGPMFDNIFKALSRITPSASLTSFDIGEGDITDAMILARTSPRASGGPLKAKEISLVGEKGPEIFVPDTAGKIIPNHELTGKEITLGVDVPRLSIDIPPLFSGIPKFQRHGIFDDSPRSQTVQPVSVTVINNSDEKAETRETTDPDGTRNIEILIGQAVSQNIHRGGTIDSAIRNSYGLKRPGSHR